MFLENLNYDSDMSWLRKSTIGYSIGKLKNLNASSKEFDPSACFDSFRKHWQQIDDVIEKTKVSTSPVKQDDVLSVVCNLEHMVTLLVFELRSGLTSLACLEHVLSENLLDKLFSWSIVIEKFENALKSEQLRLYEIVLSNSDSQLLVNESFHRPLLRLLASCSDAHFTLDVERRLVILLNQLCVSLVHRSDLLDLFFDNQDESPKFLIFSLLIPFVHREGTLGQQARDALLLCMAMSKQHDSVAQYITHISNVCPVMAAGLCGLYSRLPRKLVVESGEWYRLTPDDINDLPELAAFMNSLEFCNAVVQVGHPTVVNHLLDYLYQGFLVRVLGPALLQSTEEELMTATAYLDLFIRSLSDPGLLHSFVKFLLKECYDNQRIIECLIERIQSNSRLSLVTVALMETLVALESEDILLELVFKHLIPCNHVMASQRSRVNHLDPYCRSADKFLQLSPNLPRNQVSEGSLYGDYQAYLADARLKIHQCASATSIWVYPYNGEIPPCVGLPTSYTDSEAEHSLPSADDGSSGYESFARINEIPSDCGSGGEYDSPSGSEICSEGKPPSSLIPLPTTPSIGPFLEAIFNKLENMLKHDLSTNLHITGLISRLAVYPQPLLRSFLLDHTLVFQPSIRSLIQVIGWVKQKIESVLKEQSFSQVKNLTVECEAILLDREHRLVNARKYALHQGGVCTTNGDSFERGDMKRKSFTHALNSVFRRPLPAQSKDHQLLPVESGYRYIAKSGEVKNAVMCGLILGEWLKELAAIAQEHSVYQEVPDYFL